MQNLCSFEASLASVLFYSMNKAKNLMQIYRTVSKPNKVYTSQKGAVGNDFKIFVSKWVKLMFVRYGGEKQSCQPWEK